MGEEAQGFEPYSAAFLGPKQGAGSEVVLLGQESVPIWDPSTMVGGLAFYTMASAPTTSIFPKAKKLA